MDKDQIIDFYKSTNQYYANYHNHKETSAWAGLVLYMAFAGLINLFKIPVQSQIEITILISFFVVAITVFVYRYISIQLKMKDRAGAYSAAAFSFLNELMTNKKLTESELVQYLEIEESEDTIAQSSHVLPKKFLKKSRVLNTRGRGFQDQTRTMIYGILFAICFLTLTLKFWALVA
ncbi:hypothetical protein [Reichenbachiella versicolor]|uniref:hypothetical protein n=1 Tax=Reichenbachiella versicolor TaxID=1821036 RepID=UPI000D6E2961|nr:hypothetical protein [Reichenbachiella versicolor]